VPLLTLLLGVVCTAPAVVRGGGQAWVVGDNMAWSFGVAGWAKGKAIQAGDVLGERLIKQYGLVATQIDLSWGCGVLIS
jgi:hypothetical protein